MSFHSDQEMRTRLQNTAPLTREEVKDLFPWIRGMLEGDLRILQAHIALLTMQCLDENKEAIERFNRSSTRLTWAIIALTLVYTAVAIWQLVRT